METALQKGREIDESGEIIHFETRCPWKEHLYDLEKELNVAQPIKYVLYSVSFLTPSNHFHAPVDCQSCHEFDLEQGATS